MKIASDKMMTSIRYKNRQCKQWILENFQGDFLHYFQLCVMFYTFLVVKTPYYQNNANLARLKLYFGAINRLNLRLIHNCGQNYS